MGRSRARGKHVGGLGGHWASKTERFGAILYHPEVKKHRKSHFLHIKKMIKNLDFRAYFLWFGNMAICRSRIAQNGSQLVLRLIRATGFRILGVLIPAITSRSNIRPDCTSVKIWYILNGVVISATSVGNYCEILSFLDCRFLLLEVIAGIGTPEKTNLVALVSHRTSCEPFWAFLERYMATIPNPMKYVQISSFLIFFSMCKK